MRKKRKKYEPGEVPSPGDQSRLSKERAKLERKKLGFGMGFVCPAPIKPSRTLCLCVALSCLRFRMVGEWVATQLILELLQAGCCEGWDRLELRRVNFRCVSCAVSDCVALHELS